MRNQFANRALYVAAIVGFALFLSSSWTARSSTIGLPQDIMFVMRFSKVAVYFITAYVLRNHIPDSERLAIVVAGVTLPGIAMEGMQLAQPDLSVPLLISASLIDGISGGIITLLFAHLFSSFAPSKSAIGLASVYFLNEVLILGSDFLSVASLQEFRFAFKIAGVLLLAICFLAKRTIVAPEGDHPLQYGIARKEGETDKPLRFLSLGSDWALLLLAGLLFPTIFGLVAQLCSEPGAGWGLYDPINEIAALACIGFTVMLMVIKRPSFGFAGIMSVVVPLYAIGCLVFSMFWQQNTPAAGIFIKCGYTVYNVLLWILLARKSFEDPRHTYLYFGVFLGASTVQYGRIIGDYLRESIAVDSAVLLGATNISLCLTCLFVLFLFLKARKEADEARATIVQSKSTEGNEARDPFSMKMESFIAANRFTPREQEVVIEALHGYSRNNIAKKLFLSPETVKTYLSRAYDKAGVSSKQELIQAIDRFEDETAPSKTSTAANGPSND